MMNKSDPLIVLFDVKEQLGLSVDKELIEACYELQKLHQYDKERTTLKQMQKLVEATLPKDDGENIS